MRNKSLFLLLALGLFLVPLASAVTLDVGTVLNTTYSNSSITVTSGCVLTVTQAVVENNGVALYTPAFASAPYDTAYSLPTLINYTGVNKGITSCDFISLYATSTAQKTTCEGALTGLQQFGSWLPIIIAVLIGGVAVMFLMGNNEGALENTEDMTMMILVAIVAVVIGAVIISYISSGAC